jgi:hypothetical protein
MQLAGYSKGMKWNGFELPNVKKDRWQGRRCVAAPPRFSLALNSGRSPSNPLIPGVYVKVHSTTPVTIFFTRSSCLISCCFRTTCLCLPSCCFRTTCLWVLLTVELWGIDLCNAIAVYKGQTISDIINIITSMQTVSWRDLFRCHQLEWFAIHTLQCNCSSSALN